MTKEKLPIINITGKTAVVGDIHGSVMNMIKHKERTEFEGVKNIIFLGDIGFGFLYSNLPIDYKDKTDDEIAELHVKYASLSAKYLLEDIVNASVFITRNKDINVYLIRGNHDDPYYWSEDYSSIMKSVFPNVTFLPDCFLKINDNFWYTFGGAVSIDANRRIPGISFWKDEIIKNVPSRDIIPEEIDLTNLFGILSHTGPCPRYHYKGSNDFIGISYVGENLVREKEIIDSYLLKFSPKFWVCGHYHYPIEEDFGYTHSRVVGCDEVFILPENCSTED